MLRLAATRAAPVIATGAVGAWAAVTTSNDDWDEYFPPAPASTDRERIVIPVSYTHLTLPTILLV